MSLGFLQFTFVDLIDILLVAAVIFIIFRWIRGSSAMNIFIAIIILLVVRVLATALNMKMTSAMLGAILDVGALAIIIIFQPEIRHLLNRFAINSGLARRTGELFNRLFGIKEEQLGSRSVEELSEAVRAMSAEKTGALIVIQHKSTLDEYIRTGDSFDAGINRRLVMNIFFKNSPLHDGAMIIVGNRIVAARCQLPMTNRKDIPAHYGMRHRAAIGVTEDTDADVIVVSEETGTVSFVRGGQIETMQDMKDLREKLASVMKDQKE